MTTLSIITAVLNNVNTINDCLSSIHGQSVQPLEHIIIDGASTDGTLDIIRNNKNEYTKIFSAPDEGIYHGMNKGLALATGDVIGTLNADDMYYDNDVLAKVTKCFEVEEIDSCYGDLLYVEPESINKTVRYWKSGNFNSNKFRWGWMVPHPTFFVRREIYEKYGLFNTKMGTAADYELMLRFLVKFRISSYYIRDVLIKMRTGGASNSSFTNRIKANRMDKLAWEVNRLKPYPWTVWMKPLRKIMQWILFPKDPLI